MKREIKQFTNEQLKKAFANSNFGSQSKRDTVVETLSTVAMGYVSGKFSMSIMSELGLIQLNNGRYSLTKSGVEVLRNN